MNPHPPCTFAKVTDVTVVGVSGHLVAVEAHVGRGLPDKLSQRDLTFVGVDTCPVGTPGWVGLYLDDPLEGFGLGEGLGRAERDLTVGSRERLEFLG